MPTRHRWPALLLAAIGLITSCGPAGSGSSPPPTFGSGPAAASTPAASPPTPSPGTTAPSPAAPKGLPVPAAGEGWAAFWARRDVAPPPPTTLLDQYAALRLPAVKDETAKAVNAGDYARAALRQLSGEQYALSHLRADLTAAGVLGAPGLSGDAGSISAATQTGLVAVTSALTGVQAAAVVALAPAVRKATGEPYLVLLRVSFGPVTGRYRDGSSKALPAGKPVTYALVGHLVRARLLGTFFFVQAAYDCSSAAKGGAIARACATV